MKKRTLHILIIAGVLVLVLPMGFDLKSSGIISIGFGSVFSLIRLNAKLFHDKIDSTF